VLRELLGTAFLLEPPREVPPQLFEVVRSVRRSLPPDPQPPAVVAPPPAPPPAAWVVAITVLGNVSLFNGEASVRTALALSGERRLGSSVYLSLGAQLSYTHGYRFASLEVPASLGLHVPLEAGPLRLGPFVEALIGWQRLTSPKPTRPRACPPTRAQVSKRAPRAARVWCHVGPCMPTSRPIGISSSQRRVRSCRRLPRSRSA